MKSLVPLIILMLAGPLGAEVVHLVDGGTLEGDLRRTNEGWIVTAPNGVITVLTTAQVKSIELKKVDSAESTDQRLASLRRAVANQSDIHQIIDRYQTFITQYANTPAAAEARKDLATWQQRLDQGLVKAGEQWVSPQQLADLQAHALKHAEEVRTLLIAGKLNDAATAIEKALAVSPDSPALLYLKGLIAFKQLQLVPARNAFQSVAVALPDNAPAHNNIGVIVWKQRAQMQALAEYDKAMLADPQNQTILDNVAEALHALPAEHRKNDLTKRVVAHFNDQDAALQKTMETKGLYRWGSQWLGEKEFNKVQAQQKEVNDKLASMQKEFDGLQADLLRIDRDIQSDQQTAQSMQASSIQQDPVSGRMYQLPLPQRYYDLLHDINTLKADKVLKQRQVQDLQKLAVQQKNQLPQPTYTGVQKMLDADLMPGGRPLQSSSGFASGGPTTLPVVVSSPPVPQPAPQTSPSPSSTGGADFGPPQRF